ncbi:MAG: hypothetical protein ACP5G0_06275 [Desulfomonilia bacterium]
MIHTSLNRREILEALIRQGIVGITRLKRECRCFEAYWKARQLSHI